MLVIPNPPPPSPKTKSQQFYLYSPTPSTPISKPAVPGIASSVEDMLGFVSVSRTLDDKRYVYGALNHHAKESCSCKR